MKNKILIGVAFFLFSLKLSAMPIVQPRMPFLECEESRNVFKSLKNTGLNPDKLNDVDYIIFLQEERKRMNSCALEAAAILIEIVAGKYKDERFHEQLIERARIITQTKTTCDALKADQDREWKEFLRWQAKDSRGVYGDDFDKVRDKAVERWKWYEDQIKKCADHITKIWNPDEIGKFQQQETVENEYQTGTAAYYSELVSYAITRIEKIDGMLKAAEDRDEL